MSTRSLWHWTCSHQAPGIIRCGTLLAYARWNNLSTTRAAIDADPALKMASQVVWCTTLDDIDSTNFTEIGISPHLENCDRAAYRFRVWPGQYLRAWSDVRQEWPAKVVAAIERPGSRPGTWWVSGGPVHVTISPRPRVPALHASRP